MQNSLCNFSLPNTPYKIKRIFNDTVVSEVFLKDHLKILQDDTIDDVIGKVASHYKINPPGIYIFSLEEPLIYRAKNFPFDVNPFVSTSEYTGITTPIEEDREVLHTKCLIDFEIQNNELYVVYIEDLMSYAKTFDLIVSDIEKYSKDILAWYFKHDFLEQSSYELYEEKAKVRYNLENTSLNNELKFNECVLLEAQILVNENETKPFVDLHKIFNIITLDKELSFVYQRGNSPAEVRVKVLNGITHTIEDPSVLIGWLNTVKSDMEVKSNKSLILKLKNYNDNYSTITIYRNGKIEIRCQWSEEKNAGVQELVLQIQKVVQLIEHINKHKYNLPKLPNELASRKIISPNVDTMMQWFETGTAVGNTRVSLCNISSSFNAKNINFELLNDYIAKNFYSVADVVYKNTRQLLDSTGNPTTYYTKPSSAYIRYKQYSSYGDSKNAMTFIHNVTTNTVGLKKDPVSRDKLASIVSKKFMIPLEQSKSLVNNIVETFDYSLILIQHWNMLLTK